MKPDAVIFDLFGTLVHNTFRAEFQRAFSEISKGLGVDSDEFVQVWDETYHSRTIGAFKDIESNLRATCEALRQAVTEERILTATRIRYDLMRRCLAPRPDAAVTLSKLRTTGYGLGMVSDCSPEVPGMWNDHPLAGMLDDAVFSCRVGLRKPDPEIFQLACRNLGVLPERCVYVGDGGSDELAGATRVGMRAVRIHLTFEEDRELAWDGETITTLSELLPLLDAG